MALLHAEGRPRLVPKWGGRPSGTEENRNKLGIRTPASSGRTTRHRLNRSGDRQLNRALHAIVLTRARIDPTTQAYIARRTTEGKTIREIKRALKREASPASSSDSYKPPSNNRQRRTKPDKAPAERQWTPAPTSPERSPADSPKVALDGT
jgi:hypothetical protein